MKRRTLLSALTIGTAGLAGCSTLTGDGATETLPEEDTLTPTETESGGGGGETTSGGETAATAADTTSASDDDGGGGGDDTDTASPTPDATATKAVNGDGPYNAMTEDISKCGTTCRTLTYTLQNRGSEDLSGITVNFKVFTPDKDGKKIYDNDQDVGSLSAQSQRQGIQKDIDVGLGGASSLRGNDGEAIIQLTPTSDSGASQTFLFPRNIE
jgi:hypothetical protein